MNGKYQVGSGRVVTVAHDSPFINDSISQPNAKSNTSDKNSSDRRSSRAQLDEGYLQAVESGDMRTAQRMVDEAAKEPSYANTNVKPKNAAHKNVKYRYKFKNARKYRRKI